MISNSFAYKSDIFKLDYTNNPLRISFRVFRTIENKDIAISQAYSVFIGPTGNCQMSIVCYMNYVLALEDSFPGITPSILYVMSSIVHKPLFLIDVSQFYDSKIKKSIHSDLILINDNYTSTNKSSMMVLLINCSKISEPKYRNHYDNQINANKPF